MISHIISSMINVEFQISSLQMNKSACDFACKEIGGHIPYFHEAESILSQLYKDEEINRDKYEIFNTRKRSLGMQAILDCN